jgi:hypothetical protein
MYVPLLIKLLLAVLLLWFVILLRLRVLIRAVGLCVAGVAGLAGKGGLVGCVDSCKTPCCSSLNKSRKTLALLITWSLHTSTASRSHAWRQACQDAMVYTRMGDLDTSVQAGLA